MTNRKIKKAGKKATNSKPEVEMSLADIPHELILVAMVIGIVIGTLFVRWGCDKWLKAEGFGASAMAWALLSFGVAGLGNVTRILRKMVAKFKSQTLQTKWADVVVMALIFPAYWLSDIFKIGWSCWWEGFFNTLFASQAFFAGILVYYNAYVGFELLWGMFCKSFKKA